MKTEKQTVNKKQQKTEKKEKENKQALEEIKKIKQKLPKYMECLDKIGTNDKNDNKKATDTTVENKEIVDKQHHSQTSI